jgi:hypothetical protein
MTWIFHEPRPDPQLGAALRRLESERSTGQEDLLRERIVAAARPMLAQLRSPASPRWWEWLSRWVSIALPVGLAASLVGGLLLARSEASENLGDYSVELATTDSTLVNAAYAGLANGTDVASHVIAPAGGEWLFEQVLSQ